MNSIDDLIYSLSIYAVKKGLIDPFERIYSINLLLDVLNIDEYKEENAELISEDLESLLDQIDDYAFYNNLIESNSIVYRDLFDTKVMNCFIKRPKEIVDEFYNLYKISPEKATDFFYNYSKDSNYIRYFRVLKDKKWSYESEDETLQITINLSKPEKDPKAIAMAKLNKSSSYPKCQLCFENMGYRGRLNHPARENIRVIPLDLNGDDFYFQYSPYSYYNEHCIVFNSKHIPMKVDRACLNHLISFVDMFPHYMLGSNADLPIVGGSILTHDHYQGGRYRFPMFDAKDVFSFSLERFKDVRFSYLNWPLSTIRVISKNKEEIIEAADHIISCWRKYSDIERYIIAKDKDGEHNTVTPICRKQGDNFIFELILRNNITSDSYPLGYYHPHQECWNIKKENIGLIEAMGVAILPSRLKEELEIISKCLVDKEELTDEKVLKHRDWVNSFKEDYIFTKEDVDSILQKEVGKTFKKVLEYAGVYKRDEEGLLGIKRFISTL